MMMVIDHDDHHDDDGGDDDDDDDDDDSNAITRHHLPLTTSPWFIWLLRLYKTPKTRNRLLTNYDYYDV